MSAVPSSTWPRLRALPTAEQAPFERWLSGQTRPLIADVPLTEQDGYFPWDYERWKKKLPVKD